MPSAPASSPTRVSTKCVLMPRRHSRGIPMSSPSLRGAGWQMPRTSCSSTARSAGHDGLCRARRRRHFQWKSGSTRRFLQSSSRESSVMRCVDPRDGVPDQAGRRGLSTGHAAAGRGRGRTALIGVFGFTVNLSWVREHYFPDLASQVAQIAGATDELTVHLLDDDGRDIVAIGGRPIDGSVRRHRLPLVFFDPSSSRYCPRRGATRICKSKWACGRIRGGRRRLSAPAGQPCS